MSEKKIVLGAGCFWGIEEKIRIIKGVRETDVGYSGGMIAHPTYEQVCTGKTGHAEVARVLYDTALLPTQYLIDAFYKMHDPWQVNRQGPDVGSQYRSVIFYEDQEQRRIAHDLKEAGEQKDGVFYATEILPISDFYLAEEYHQKYLLKKKSL